MKPLTLLAYLFLAFCSFKPHPSLGAKSICHAIIVADLDAKDLQKDIERDLERMQSQLRRISKYAKVKIKEKLFLGDPTDPKKMSKYLKKLKIQPEDMLVFCFSGHGHRLDSNGTSAWPNIGFQIADVGIPLEEIVTLLNEKQARLTIIIADCCNVRALPLEAPATLMHLNAKHIHNAFMDVSEKEAIYEKLFKKPRGILVAVSALPGEYAYSEEIGGSLFTKVFTTWLEDSLHRDDISWQTWLMETERLLGIVTENAKVQQHPFIFNAIVE